MTDNEIVKALECCKELICKDCPIFPNSTPVLLCKRRLEIKALDLIKRQQAEIAELRVCAEKNNDKLNSVIDCQEAEIERLSKPQGVTFLANGIEIHAKDSDEYYKFKRLVKSEAITEFAKRLKTKMLDWCFDFEYYSEQQLAEEQVDNLVKEMTEDINDT